MSDHGDPGDRKRRRTALACSACRTRKTKCDGRRPRCTSCASLSFECIYVQSSSTPNVIVGKEYLGSLEERVQRVETMLRTLIEGLPETSAEWITAARFHKSSASTHIEHRGLPPSNSSPSEGTGPFASEDEDCYFGPSSNIALCRQIARSLSMLSYNAQPNTGETWSVPRPQESPSMSSGDESSQKYAASGSTFNAFALPPMDKVREMVETYFQWTGLMYPFIHKDSFMSTLAVVERSDWTKVRRTWLGMLNMILALANNVPVSHHQGADLRATESELYYRRAQVLCDQDVLQGTSVELVQYMLLVGQYLHGTQKSIKAWNINGLAVKTAFQLGLHSSEASRTFSALEQETRKRVWYVCVMQDWNMGMTFGRPGTIQDRHVRLDPLQPFSSHPDRLELESAEFFNAYIRLHRTMWQIIEKLYGGNLGCGDDTPLKDHLSTALQLDQDLVTWECGLPPHMTPVSTNDIGQKALDARELAVIRFRTILTMRRHMVHMLIYRIIIFRILNWDPSRANDVADKTLLQRAAPNAVQSTTRAALDCIALVHATMMAENEQQRPVQGAWWFTLYYTFNASLVLVTISLIWCQPRTRQFVENFVQPQAISSALYTAVAALRHINPGSPITSRCEHHLTTILGAIERTQSSHHAEWTASLPSGAAGSSDEWASHMDSAQSHQQSNRIQQSGIQATSVNFHDAEVDWDSFLADTGQEFFFGM